MTWPLRAHTALVENPTSAPMLGSSEQLETVVPGDLTPSYSGLLWHYTYVAYAHCYKLGNRMSLITQEKPQSCENPNHLVQKE